MPQSINPAILNAADQVETDLEALDVSTRALLQLLRAGEGQGTPFAPSDITNLSLWLDASDASTITDAGGGAVSAWASKDANTRGFAQATAGLRPTTGTTTQNSLNTISFAADYLTTTEAKSVWNFLHGSAEHSIYFVAKFGTVANPDAGYGFMGTQGAAAVRGVTHLWDDRSSSSRNENWLSIGRNASDSILSFVAGNGVMAPNTHLLVALKADYDAGSPYTNRLSLRVNNGSEVKTNTAIQAPSSGDSQYDLQIGAGGNAFFPMTGEIAEILVYEKSITSGEHALITTYLADKWGLTVA